MPTRIRMLQVIAVLMVLPLAACTGSVASPGPGSADSPAPASPAPTQSLVSSITPSSSGEPEQPTPSSPVAATPIATSPPPTAATFQQPWAVATLTDVSTGTQFRIADLAAPGKVVFVETMAIWCANCHAQQVAAVAAFQELDPATVEWVAIDVETAETAEALARYRDQNGFPFRYAIADSALSRALADEFGDVVLSPPTVNVIVLGTDGRISHLRGHHSSADLVALAIDHGS